MIFTDSRYADGVIVKAYSPRTSNWELSAARVFPTATADYFLYQWREGDRIDLISNGFLGTSALWWKIMDYNPEILNPFTIPVGTTMRIPNVR